MIDSPELFILDVGHGNCAILLDKNTVTLIDCPPSPIITQVLERLDVEVIDNVLISHSDVDHVGGLKTLLNDFTIKNVYLNPDANKVGNKNNLWMGVRIALRDAQEKGTIVQPTLTTTLSKNLKSDDVEIEILAPSPAIALGGGKEDIQGRKLTSNSMSAVIGLVHKGFRVALLPGDIDEVGLSNLLEERKELEAKILVFPHHGGNPGSLNCQGFAYELCKLVQPSLVIFSHGRNKFNNPKVGTVQGVISAIPSTHIMCTQLSKRCAVRTPKNNFSHLTNLPAEGFINDYCCGGTIRITLDGNQSSYKPEKGNHQGFVNNKSIIPSALCMCTSKDYKDDDKSGFIQYITRNSDASK